MDEELLLEIGLTKSEISVYLALLEIGSSTTGPIIKKAGISSGKAYLILDRLALKGLVTHAIRGGTRHYQANDPERLLVYIKEKQNDLKEKESRLARLVKNLKLKYEEKKYSPMAEIYEGIRGFKTFHSFMLNEVKEGDTVYVMGAPREANEKYNVFFMDWNKKRIKKRVKLKILYSHDSKQFGKQRAALKLTEVRYAKKELETPAWVDIFKDYVVTLNVHETPICFLIKNKESAISYQKYFDLLWKQAKP